MRDFLGGPIFWGDLHLMDNWGDLKVWGDLILLGGPQTPLHAMNRMWAGGQGTQSPARMP